MSQTRKTKMSKKIDPKLDIFCHEIEIKDVLEIPVYVFGIYRDKEYLGNVTAYSSTDAQEKALKEDEVKESLKAKPLGKNEKLRICWRQEVLETDSQAYTQKLLTELAEANKGSTPTYVMYKRGT